MTLLFDENLSPRLPAALASQFPTSTHVRAVNLLGADDQQIWEYARAHGLIIVSTDTDFRERSFVDGHPPKVIWLDVGNAGTNQVRNCSARIGIVSRCSKSRMSLHF